MYENVVIDHTPLTFISVTQRDATVKKNFKSPVVCTVVD